MRLLLLVRGGQSKAGSGRNAANMIKAITAAGFELDILEYKGSFISCALRALRMARGVDIVQAIDMNPLGFIGYIVTRVSRTKFVIVAQAGYALAPLEHRKTALLSRLAYRAADRIIAGSGFVAREIEQRVHGVHVQVIDPGIDMTTFRGASEARTPDAPPFMLSVGAVKARKGHDVSMRAFALARKSLPGLRYIIVGSQTDESRFFASVKALAQELGVDRDVEFRSGVSDEALNDLYRRASLFILTSSNVGSHIEGFGMVFLEAAAYGLPSIREVVDEQSAVLVPADDAAAFSQGIRRAVSEGAAMPGAAQTRVQQYSWNARARHILAGL